MKPRLWLIGGTQESRWIVEKLKAARENDSAQGAVLISVTTEAARSLYPALHGVAIWVGQLQPSQADDFLEKFGITAILDISHPFATQISELAIALAQRYDLPYLRYERPPVESPPQTWRDRRDRPGFVSLSHLNSLFAENLLLGERTLLLLGYRSLMQFQLWQTRCVLFARILPSSTALTTALAAGFTADHLIALRPPISPPLEMALWQQWQISQVVTKASGQPGGEAQKQAIAAALGVRLLCLARPAMEYPQQTDSLDTALSFALRYCT